MSTGMLRPERVEEFVSSLRGAVVRVDDPEYDTARRVWNGMIDRRPAAIVRCRDSADVMAAVRFGRAERLPIAVRCGGHNVAGQAVCDGGLVIDLAALRSVRVDASRSVVRAGGGALLGDIDHEVQAFGMATPVGAVSETGIGGLALHGGLGFLSRRYGLTADNLVSADVVTADGSLIVADEEHHADLLWALKGGGGSFGVVTSFEFRLHPVGPEVYFVLTFYAAEQAESVLKFFRDFMPDAPDELMAIAIYWNAPAGDPIPEPHHGAPVMVVAGCWCGPVEVGERVTRPLRHIATPIADISGPMPYLAVQSLFDHDYPKGLRYYWKSLYLDELSDDAIRLACDTGAERPTSRSTVEVWALGGAVGRVRPEETAFFHRSASFLLAIEANAEDPRTDEDNIAWVRRAHAAATRFARGGTYFNFGGFWEGGEEMLAQSFGSNYPRIQAVKARYDPGNIFQHNLRIPVAS